MRSPSRVSSASSGRPLALVGVLGQLRRRGFERAADRGGVPVAGVTGASAPALAVAVVRPGAVVADGRPRRASAAMALATVQPSATAGPPGAIAAGEGDRRAIVDDPQSVAHGLEQPSIVGHDEERRRRLAHERLDRLACRDVEVVGRFVEEQQVGRLDAEERQLQARALATGQRADLLEHVVAAEQEAGQVRARLAVGHRDGLDQRVEDGRPGMAAPRSWAR